MRRYRKGQIFRPPTAMESGLTADAVEGYRVRPGRPQDNPPGDPHIIVLTHEDGIPARDGTTISAALCKRCIQKASGSEQEIVPTDELRRVFNITEVPIPGGVYVATGETECGTRFVLPAGGPIIRARLTEPLYDCQEALATVLRTADPEEPPCDEGDIVTITSPLGLVAGSILAVLDDVDEWSVPAGTAVYARRFGDTGKYEALAFGSDPCCEEESSSSGSSSGSSDSESESVSESDSESTGPCRDMIGRYNLADIPGYNAGVRQYLVHDAAGCLQWLTPTEC